VDWSLKTEFFYVASKKESNNDATAPMEAEIPKPAPAIKRMGSYSL
jgi:hypothetical protein